MSDGTPLRRVAADRIGAPGSPARNAIPRHQRRQLVLNHPDRREDGRHSKAICTSSGFEPHSTGWEGSIWGIPDTRRVRGDMGQAMERESMAFDVVVVGAGPSGLTTAIRLKQLAAAEDRDINVCVIEKGSEVGAHILSGAVIEPRALFELFPDAMERGAPLNTPVKEDRFLLLTKGSALRLPTPPQTRNHGNYIVSLGNLCRWLAGEAEALGVEIYPGFAAAEVLYDDSGRVKGVATGDMGLVRDGEPGSKHEPGVELHASQTVFAEGCRGSLGKTLMARFDLARDSAPQDLRYRDQGIVGGRSREPSSRPRGSFLRLAPPIRHLWRFLPLPPGGQPGRGRFHNRARLQQPAYVAVRGVPALQDPPGDPSHLGRRSPHRLWRARHQRRRLPVDPQARLSGRRVRRLRGRIF